MQALKKVAPENGALEIVETSTPEFGSTDALVRVHTANVCGSDVGIYKWKESYHWIDTPITIGHEYSGTVEAVGDAVTSVEVGDRVTELPAARCGQCPRCLDDEPHICEQSIYTGYHVDGAFAEYISIPANQLAVIPDDLSLRAASLTEPTSIATHAVYDKSSVTAGDHVVVQGIGPIGILLAYAVSAHSPRSITITGTNVDSETRIPTANQIGFDTINVEEQSLWDEIDRRTDGVGADVVFDATGNSLGVEASFDIVRKGGEIISVGIPTEPARIDFASVTRREIDVRGAHSNRWTNFEQSFSLLADVIDVDSLVTSYSLSDVPTAFEDALAKRVIKPQFSLDGE